MTEFETDPCEICDYMAKKQQKPNDNYYWDCPFCGSYFSSFEASINLRSVDNQDRPKLFGWVRKQNRESGVPHITTSTIKLLLSNPSPTFIERANYLLLEALKNKGDLDINFNFTEPKYIAATYSKNPNDVSTLIDHLCDRGLLGEKTFEHVKITGKGHIAADELRRKPSGSTKCFVAMWFDDEMNEVYDKGFQIGISKAGYDPVRIDMHEHINKIDDEIIAHINSSAFIVADFTAHRGGVYFEAGYALGRGLPVIWTCRKEDMGELHFDIRQYNCIDWETTNELADRLQKRIEASIGRRPEYTL